MTRQRSDRAALVASPHLRAALDHHHAEGAVGLETIADQSSVAGLEHVERKLSVWIEHRRQREHAKESWAHRAHLCTSLPSSLLLRWLPVRLAGASCCGPYGCCPYTTRSRRKPAPRSVVHDAPHSAGRLLGRDHLVGRPAPAPAPYAASIWAPGRRVRYIPWRHRRSSNGAAAQSGGPSSSCELCAVIRTLLPVCSSPHPDCRPRAWRGSIPLCAPRPLSPTPGELAHCAATGDRVGARSSVVILAREPRVARPADETPDRGASRRASPPSTSRQTCARLGPRG